MLLKNAFLGSLDRRLLAATVLVGLLALAVTWALARGIVRPLEELRAATADLARGQLSRRVTPSGSGEVTELGRAFNTMAGELERQQALRQSLVHEVAHELRTELWTADGDFTRFPKVRARNPLI